MEINEALETLNDAGLIAERERGSYSWRPGDGWQGHADNWQKFEAQDIVDALYKKFDPDFGGRDGWSCNVAAGNIVYVYHGKNTVKVKIKPALQRVEADAYYEGIKGSTGGTVFIYNDKNYVNLKELLKDIIIDVRSLGSFKRPTPRFSESVEKLDENKLSEYLLDKVYRVAEEIYAREISDNVPDLESNNRPSRDYLERFDYLSDSLKAAVKRAATALQSELKTEGFDVNIEYVQNEIYDALKLYAK